MELLRQIIEVNLIAGDEREFGRGKSDQTTIVLGWPLKIATLISERFE
jgi:hypothetical protein